NALCAEAGTGGWGEYLASATPVAGRGSTLQYKGGIALIKRPFMKSPLRHSLSRSFFPLLVSVVASSAVFLAQQDDKNRLAPYYTTPETIVDKMLQLGELKAGEVMFDLGSGDGRIVIMAARKYKAKANGVEFDPDLVKLSQERVKQLGLEKN